MDNLNHSGLKKSIISVATQKVAERIDAYERPDIPPDIETDLNKYAELKNWRYEIIKDIKKRIHFWNPCYFPYVIVFNQNGLVIK